MPSIRLGKKTISLPRSRTARVAVGSGFVVGGALGFLPVLGFWMLPIGLIVLSHDFPRVRRLRRQTEVALLRRWARFRNKAAPSAK
ncbi:hypothetical protein K32_20460 [Kaistia sp. 32K]|uniref:hypothetical protein n=1 Tax=Kaistia sp. 32K TaxID=2795690 RepID=UPI0019159349|nr:hypothetical protein [Kaistia sp. 32K]BCP53429.1 hypothetical protein K32_20460 [Kaistia sp. 32K]